MKFKNFGRRFRRSSRAVSPVIAVLLMIVIAVAASLFAYSWVTGYLDFLTIKVDQGVQIQAINWDGTTITAYVQNVGPANVTVSNLYIDDVLDTAFSPLILGPGETQMIQSTGIYDGTNPQVTVKVTTADGNIFMLKKTVTTSTGGGGVVVPPPTVTRVSDEIEYITITNGIGSADFDDPITDGNLLVVIIGNRVGDPWDHNTPTISGYTRQEVEWYSDHDGDTSQRRIVAIFTKEAGASEPSTVNININNDAAADGSCFVILQQFTGADSYTKVDSGGDSSDGTKVNTLTVPASPLSTTDENILAIGAMVWRNDPTQISGVSFSGLGGMVSDISTSLGSASAYDYTPGSATVLQTTVTWTNTNMASGLLVLFSCS